MMTCCSCTSRLRFHHSLSTPPPPLYMMLRSSVSAAVTSLALALALSLTVADSHLFVDVSLCCLSALVASPLPPLSSVCAPTDHHYYNRLLVVSLHCEGVGGRGRLLYFVTPSLSLARTSFTCERTTPSLCLSLSLSCLSCLSPCVHNCHLL
jgi:hypothetical protein